MAESKNNEIRSNAIRQYLIIFGPDEELLNQAINDNHYLVRISILEILQYLDNEYYEKYKKILDNNYREDDFDEIIKTIKLKVNSHNSNDFACFAKEEICYLKLWGKKITPKLIEIAENKNENSNLRKLIIYLLRSPEYETSGEFYIKIIRDNSEMRDIRHYALINIILPTNKAKKKEKIQELKEIHTIEKDSQFKALLGLSIEILEKQLDK